MGATVPSLPLPLILHFQSSSSPLPLALLSPSLAAKASFSDELPEGVPQSSFACPVEIHRSFSASSAQSTATASSSSSPFATLNRLLSELRRTVDSIVRRPQVSFANAVLLSLFAILFLGW
jgi:hypothetical protein